MPEKKQVRLSLGQFWNNRDRKIYHQDYYGKLILRDELKDLSEITTGFVTEFAAEID
jgi:hypothetical protein